MKKIQIQSYHNTINYDEDAYMQPGSHEVVRSQTPLLDCVASSHFVIQAGINVNGYLEKKTGWFR